MIDSVFDPDCGSENETLLGRLTVTGEEYKPVLVPVVVVQLSLFSWPLLQPLNSVVRRITEMALSCQLDLFLSMY